MALALRMVAVAGIALGAAATAGADPVAMQVGFDGQPGGYFNATPEPFKVGGETAVSWSTIDSTNGSITLTTSYAMLSEWEPGRDMFFTITVHDGFTLDLGSPSIQYTSSRFASPLGSMVVGGTSYDVTWWYNVDPYALDNVDPPLWEAGTYEVLMHSDAGMSSTQYGAFLQVMFPGVVTQVSPEPTAAACLVPLLLMARGCRRQGREA